MTDSQNNNQTIPCPECDSPLIFTKAEKGEIIECHICGCESEVLAVNPVKISPLEEEK